jgi:hypothetical protein
MHLYKTLTKQIVIEFVERFGFDGFGGFMTTHFITPPTSDARAKFQAPPSQRTNPVLI